MRRSRLPERVTRRRATGLRRGFQSASRALAFRECTFSLAASTPTGGMGGQTRKTTDFGGHGRCISAAMKRSAKCCQSAFAGSEWQDLELQSLYRHCRARARYHEGVMEGSGDFRRRSHLICSNRMSRMRPRRGHGPVHHHAHTKSTSRCLGS